MPFKVYNRNPYTGELTFVKEVKMHNCMFMKKIKGGARKYEDWCIEINGTKYVCPTREEQFGVERVCNMCKNQLNCLQGKVGVLSPKSLAI